MNLIDLLCRHRLARPALGVSLFCFGSVPAFPQASTRAGAPQAEEEAVELSPFVITAEDSDGYRATSTLAGTRLKTELGDVGAAISVMTKQLIDDLAVTDATTALSYMLNTEIMGDQGNTGFAPSRSTNGVVTAPWSEQRVRGLEPAVLSRGLFRTDIPFDTYNSGNVTVSRGPNSLLFGSGSAGGVIDNSIDVAGTTKDQTELLVRFGHRGSQRYSINHNESVIKGRLGVRIAALEEDVVYKQKPTYQDQRRYYGALTAVLREANDGFLGRTILRGSYEDVEMQSWRPFQTPPTNLFATWLELPDPAFNGVYGVNYPTYMTDGTWVPKYTVNNAARPAPAAVLGPIVRPFGRNFTLVLDDAATPQYGNYFPGNPGIQGFQGDVNGVLFWGAGEFRPGLNFAIPQLPRSAYDSENNRLGGDSGEINQGWTAWQAVIEQSFLKNKGGLEIAVSREERRSRNFVGPVSGAISVDIAQFLVTGEPNPNLGRPYASYSGVFNRQQGRGELDSFRASAFYELDLRESRLGKILGRHIFSGLFATEDQDGRTIQYRPIWADTGLVNTQAIINQNLGGANRTPLLLAYLGPSLLDPSIRTVADVRIPASRLSAPLPRSGDSFTIRYVDPSVTPVVANNNVRTGTFIAQEVPFGGNVNGYESESVVGAWQGYWLDNHLVTVLGYRKDERSVFDRVPGADIPRTNPDGVTNTDSLVLSDTPSFESSRDVWTKSVVARLPEKWNPLRKRVRVAAHWAESDNFTPSNVRRDLFYRTIESPSGDTTEMGFTLELPSRKASVRFNWFETRSLDATVPNFGVVSNFWTVGVLEPLDSWNNAMIQGVPFTTAYTNAVRGLTQPNAVGAPNGNFISYQQVMDAYRSLMPAEVQQAINLRYEGNEWAREVPSGAIDTQDRVAKGFEVDFAGNLSKAWRVMLNVGRQDTVGSNSMPLAFPEALRVRQDMIDRGLFFIFGPSNNAQFRQRWEGQVQNGVIATRVNDGRRVQEQREWRVNFVTNYAFQTDGWLRGVEVGGAVRWQSENAIGYPISLQPIAGQNVFVPDLDGAIFGPAETNIDLWVKYGRRFEKLDWRIQLNVRNAFSDGDRIPVSANPAGFADAFRHANPVEASITNTFRF